MRARDLAEAYPIVALDDDMLTAARTMGAERAPGLIVCDGQGHPYSVLSGSQVLRFLIPPYVQDEPRLARAFDERASDELRERMVRHTVRDALPKPSDIDDLPVVDGDATTIEVAVLMARLRMPLVAVTDGGRVVGAITVSKLLTIVLPA